MSTAMICLVGEQAIPNVIGALLCEPRFSRPRKVICLVSENVRVAGRVPLRFETVYAGIDQCLSQMVDADVSRRGPLSPYDVEAVEEAVRTIVADLKRDGTVDEIVVNVTGGTKLMALGAERAARALELPILYVDTENDKAIWLDTGTARTFTHRDLRPVDVERYLQAYSVTVLDEGEADVATALLDMADAIVDRGDRGGFDLAAAISPEQFVDKRVNNRQGRPTWFPFRASAFSADARGLLADLPLRFEESDGAIEVFLTPDEQDFFFRNKWLEYYTFARAGEADVFTEVRTGIKIDWTGLNRTTLRIDNELDVVASRGSHLVICECKSGTVDSDDLHKLQVVSSQLGTYVSPVLVTTSPRDVLTPDGGTTPAWVIRALTMGILVVGADRLPYLPTILADVEREVDTMQATFKLRR